MLNDANHYDVIAYFETDIQKIYVDFIINNAFAEANCLLIDARNKKLLIDNRSYNINFNDRSCICNSLKELKNIDLTYSCKYLLGTHFTGVNCRFIVSIINYKKLLLIDDGLGTPTTLMMPSIFLYRRTFILKYMILKILIYILIKKKLERTKVIISKIESYYTIYNIRTKLTKIRINPFPKWTRELITNKVGFIGAPYIDHGLITKSRYVDFLKEMIRREGPLIYYLHPDEKWSENLIISGITFIKPCCSLEKYIETNEIPGKIIGFYSSALMNLKIMNEKIDAYYIKINTFKECGKCYENILTSNNIKAYANVLLKCVKFI
jgi:hypothetical protein